MLEFPFQSDGDAGTLFDTSPWPTWILDAETFAFLAVNRAAVAHYGYSEAEFLDMTIRDVCVPEDLPLFQDQLAHLPFSFEWRATLQHRKKDGTLVHMEPARQEVVYRGRKAVLTILNDVTERLRAEEALRESEERTRLVIQASLDAVVEIDSDNCIIGWNGQAEAIFGWTRDEAIGLRLVETIIPERYRSAHISGMRNYAATGRGPLLNQRIEITALRRSGEEFPVELTVTDLRRTRGTTFCAFVRDLSEGRRSESARRQEEITRQFLTQASEVLASSLDYELTLQKVADLAVPGIADWCTVDMLEESGEARLLAVAHVDAAKVALAYSIRARYPLSPDEHGIAAVLRTGSSEVYPDIPDELLVKGARDPQHLEMIRAIGLRSVMIVAIVARNRVLGAITFVTTGESGRNYGPDNLPLAEALAARAALAIDNARLYRAAQEELIERKEAQDALVQHQAEIGALNARLRRSMSETHHRVKNNLQVISALLDMQEMQYEDVVPISEIARLRHHVQALSTIHDLLTHQAKNDAELYDLSVKEAIDKLIPIIQAMLAGRTIEFSVVDVRMPVRQITTFTVIVNELVANAIKHGRGDIRLGLDVCDGRALLVVLDEGPGFPDSFDVATAAHTGLELIQTLTKLDLHGETRFENRAAGGARVVVEFPIPSTARSAGEQ